MSEGPRSQIRLTRGACQGLGKRRYSWYRALRVLSRDTGSLEYTVGVTCWVLAPVVFHVANTIVQSWDRKWTHFQLLFAICIDVYKVHGKQSFFLERPSLRSVQVRKYRHVIFFCCRRGVELHWIQIAIVKSKSSPCRFCGSSDLIRQGVLPWDTQVLWNQVTIVQFHISSCSFKSKEKCWSLKIVITFNCTSV